MPLRYSPNARRPRCFDNDFTSHKWLQSTEHYAASEPSGKCFSLDSGLVSTRPSKGEMAPLPSANDSISCVQTPLPSTSYTEFDLIDHIHQVSEKNTATVIALGDVFRQRNELTIPTIFSLDAAAPDFNDELPGCEVYEVGQGAVVVPWNPSRSYMRQDTMESSAVWNLIRVCTTFGLDSLESLKLTWSQDVNINKTAVGRIT